LRCAGAAAGPRWPAPRAPGATGAARAPPAGRPGADAGRSRRRRAPPPTAAPPPATTRARAARARLRPGMLLPLRATPRQDGADAAISPVDPALARPEAPDRIAPVPRARRLRDGSERRALRAARVGQLDHRARMRRAGEGGEAAVGPADAAGDRKS